MMDADTVVPGLDGASQPEPQPLAVSQNKSRDSINATIERPRPWGMKRQRLQQNNTTQTFSSTSSCGRLPASASLSPSSD